MARTVIGYFPDELSADAVVRELLDLGYARKDIKTFAEPAVGGGPAGGELEAPGGSIAGSPTESTLGADQYTMRNAPIMVEVIVEDSRAERAADLFRERGARDVDVRDASLAPVSEDSIAATGHSAAGQHREGGSAAQHPPRARRRKPVR